MLDSKLIVMVRTLSAKELVRLETYVKSPFFNKSDKVFQLFSIIQKEHPKYDNPKHLLKNEVFKRLFPKKKQMDSSLRALMSQLTKLVEDFFVQLEVEKDKALKNKIFLDALIQRNLADMFYKRLGAATKALHKKPQDNDYFYQEYELSNLSYQQTILYKNRSLDSGLQAVNDNFDTFYISNKLKLITTTNHRQNIVGKEYQLNFVDEVLQFAQQEKLRDIPFVQFYYLLCMLSKTEDDIYFKQLKKLLEEKSDSVTEDELQNICLFLINYCTKKMKGGATQYNPEILKLYQFMLKENIFIRGSPYMSPHNYKNIVTIALRLKEYEWAKQFIHEYKAKIRPTFRDDVFHCNLAALHFYEGDYDNAKFYLLNINFIDPYYYIFHKTILVKTYFELKEHDPLNSTLEAFRLYLLRDTALSSYNKTAFQNFINLTKKIIRIIGGSNKSIIELQKEIKNTNPVAEWPWLQEKAADLTSLLK